MQTIAEATPLWCKRRGQFWFCVHGRGAWHHTWPRSDRLEQRIWRKERKMNSSDGENEGELIDRTDPRSAITFRNGTVEVVRLCCLRRSANTS